MAKTSYSKGTIVFTPKVAGSKPTLIMTPKPAPVRTFLKGGGVAVKASRTRV